MRRHWYRYPDHGIMLEEGETPVPTFDPDDYYAAVSIIDKTGHPYLVTVCCGPAAPLPDPLPGGRAADELIITLLNGLCSVPGPDGIRCELDPRHVTLPAQEGRYHAATTDVGVFRW